MRKTQRPDFTRAVQWLSKHMTTLTQACLVLCLALISVAYIRIFNPTASESAFSPASRPLPIYNVDTQEKKIAISFDAAWGDAKVRQFTENCRTSLLCFYDSINASYLQQNLIRKVEAL